MQTSRIWRVVRRAIGLSVIDEVRDAIDLHETGTFRLRCTTERIQERTQRVRRPIPGEG